MNQNQLLVYTYINGVFGIVCLVVCFLFFDFKQPIPYHVR